ncbi:uncharacterized protein LOC116256984 [Nymphaea colorata]|uniref:uncharacterized protein LOC116256984 n=1 Tax=Nymphaea colorata TaxID=210225 RepID=UPI00129DC941|nr:uncharacterized protein LOC116256984 [Nymphaea colorata]
MASAVVLLWLITGFATFFFIGPDFVGGHRHHLSISIPTSSPATSSSFSPQAVAWDKAHRRFIVGGASPSHPSLFTISDTGNLEPLIPTLNEFPTNSAIMALAVDPYTSRLIAVVSPSLSRVSSVLGVYDLRTLHRLSLTPLPGAAASAAADFYGNAFITDPVANLVYKSNPDGILSVLSSSQILRLTEAESQSVRQGLTGIVFVSNGFLLVAQKDSGRIFRIDAEDGVTKSVLTSGGNVTGAIGSVRRSDGNLVVVGERIAWLLKGRDNWAEATIIDELEWEHNLTAIDVTVKEGEKVYVLFRTVNGGDGAAEEQCFLKEIEFPKEAEGDHVWAFVLLGIGLGYVIFWRLQMGSLMKSMNKKTN